MRTCKICNEDKEFNYLTLAKRGNKIYKDQQGQIWHGRVCGACWAQIVQQKSNKQHLEAFKCATCGQEARQIRAKQVYCTVKCRRKAQYNRIK